LFSDITAQNLSESSGESRKETGVLQSVDKCAHALLKCVAERGTRLKQPRCPDWESWQQCNQCHCLNSRRVDVGNKQHQTKIRALHV